MEVVVEEMFEEEMFEEELCLFVRSFSLFSE